MGIYHCSVKTISRKDGRSATAAAAYRAAEIVYDRRTGEVFDYTRKKGVLATEILSPSEQSVPDWFFDREQLWNQAEFAEKRRNSRVARECEIALPHELDQESCIQLTRSFSQFLADRYNIAVDYALHAADDQSDQRNIHAHILMSTRMIEDTGFSAKTRILDSVHAGPLEIETIRVAWAEHINRSYEKAGINVTLDHRSFERQGIDQEPTQHLGPTAHEMEKKGKHTELGDHNRHVQNEQKSTVQFPVLSHTERKHIVTDLYQLSDSGKALEAALLENGFILARGDKRDFVIVHQSGSEHSLARSVDGVRIKQIREKCADLNRLALPNTEEAQGLWAEHDREVQAELVRLKKEEKQTATGGGQQKEQEQEQQSKFGGTSTTEPADVFTREEEEVERQKQAGLAELEQLKQAKSALYVEYQKRRETLKQHQDQHREQKLYEWMDARSARMQHLNEDLKTWLKEESDKYVTSTGDVLEKGQKVKELYDRALCTISTQAARSRFRKERNRAAYLNRVVTLRRGDNERKLDDEYAKELRHLLKNEAEELHDLENEHALEERNLEAALHGREADHAIEQGGTTSLNELLKQQQHTTQKSEAIWKAQAEKDKKEHTKHLEAWKAEKLREFERLHKEKPDLADNKGLMSFFQEIGFQLPVRRKLSSDELHMLAKRQLSRLAAKDRRVKGDEIAKDIAEKRLDRRKKEYSERLALADKAKLDGDHTLDEAARASALKKQQEINTAEALRLRKERGRLKDRDRDDR